LSSSRNPFEKTCGEFSITISSVKEGEQVKKRFFPLVITLALLTACAPAAEVTPSPTPTQETTPTPTATPTPAPVFEGLNMVEEPPLTEAELAAPVPEFLDEELQTLYRRMYSVYGNLFVGVLEYFDERWPLAEGQARAEAMEGPSLGDPWGSYWVATGRYAVWADFDAMVHSLMTDRLFQEENGTLPLFQEYQGRTAYLPTGKSLGGNRNIFFPDTFELIEETGDSIRFYVVGYYSNEADMRDDETREEWSQRMQKGYDESKKFEIVLLRTEDGWRFDRFALTNWK